MFLGDRLPIVRRAILAETDDEREAALEDLLELQRGDFIGIFEAMDGLPVTIRLLDPPLHEFLPNSKELAVELERMRIAEQITHLEVDRRGGGRAAQAARRRRAARRVQPDDGHARMPARPRAPRPLPDAGAGDHGSGLSSSRRRASKPGVEIMIPLVGIPKELEVLRAECVEVATEVIKGRGVKVPYLVGTMIEVPRAALTAGEIAQARRVLLVRDERPDADDVRVLAGRRRGQVPHRRTSRRTSSSVNPFETLDRTGVGRLVELATREGRETNPKLKVGVCGEHGGDPESVEFFAQVGPGLRVLLTLPGADRAARRGASGPRRERSGEQVVPTRHSCRSPAASIVGAWRPSWPWSSSSSGSGSSPSRCTRRGSGDLEPPRWCASSSRRCC